MLKYIIRVFYYSKIIIKDNGMKQKRRCHSRVFLSVLFGALLLCLSSCDELTKTESTWTLVHSAAGISRIDVTPKGDADCDTFTLYYGQSKKVTWKNDGEDYYNFSWTTYGGSSYYTKYDALRKIVFYTKY